MKMETMEELFLAEIQDLYDAEQRLVEALPGMAEAASSLELKKAIQKHLQETEAHVLRLESIFGQLGKDPKATTCDAMKGLVKEGESMVDEMDASPLRDAGIIAAANRVEHYEIAAYGSAKSFAQVLGMSNAVNLLGQTLLEEKAADRKLTEIAEGMVNSQARQMGSMQAR